MPVAEPFTDRVDAAVSADSARARLAGALAALNASQRDALLLVAWGGLTYDQVAAATGVPIGTVQSRVGRARQRLRRALGDLDPSAAIDPRWSSPGPRRVQPPSTYEEIRHG